MNMKNKMAAIALPVLAVSSMLPAARNGQNCAPTPPVACNQDSCCRTYCMGPENYGVNAAVNPRTCNGDWVFNIEGFYWNAHQEGLDYAIRNQVQVGTWETDLSSGGGQYVDAEILNPKFNWNFGFKAGVGYNTTCDGWDFGVTWTWYRGSGGSHVEAETDDNAILIALWSNANGKYNGMNNDQRGFAIATDIESHWSMKLNLVDFELGREFWNSKRLALRPFIGLRFASIDQEYDLQHKGGTFSYININPSGTLTGVNDEVNMENDFKGVGIRGGLNSVWNLGCGWAIYGDLALAIVYGRFDIDQKESLRQIQAPFKKENITQIGSGFRASRYMADLGLGVQWSSFFCDCQYGFTIALGWENHIFLDQNQLWRFTQNEAYTNTSISQTRGDLDTQGWTLSVTFDF